MTDSSSQDADQLEIVDVDPLNIEGNTLENFTKAFASSAREVQKYKYSRIFYMGLAVISISLFTSEALSVYGGNALASIFPGVEEQSDFSYAPYGPILGAFAALAAYPIYSHSKSLDVNTTQRSYYLLADSVEHYQEGEYEMSLECLEDLVQSTKPSSDSLFHIVRYYQMRDYLEQLNAAKKNDQLSDAMDETYNDVFEPICAEILFLFSENNPVREAIDQMDYVNEERHVAVEVLIDSFSQIDLPRKGRLLKILIAGVVASVIGFIIGTSWAVITLTLYMIYEGSGINSE